MAIKVLPDVGAPALVTAVDLVTTMNAPEANEPLSYVAAVAGYVSAGMGVGGDFMKNVGISSFPWAAKNIYVRVKNMMKAPAAAGASRMARVAAYPQNPSQFRNTALI